MMKKGFTAVPNNLLEKIITSDFSKRQLKILLYLIRLMQGFHRTEAITPQNYFKYCGIGENVIKKELLKLQDMNVIKILDSKKGIMAFNRDLLTWNVKTVNEKTPLPKLRNIIFSKQIGKGSRFGYYLNQKTLENNNNSNLKEIKDILKERYNI